MRLSVRYLLLLSSGLLLPQHAAWAALPLLSCTLDMNGETRTLEFKPQADPYTAQPADIGGHFRFKAVVVAEETRIAYVKTYVYYQGPRQPVLLHSAHYLTPQPDMQTGVNYVYSPRLERELKYACALAGNGQ